MLAAIQAGREWEQRVQASLAELKAAREDVAAFQAAAAKAQALAKEAQQLGVRMDAQLEALQVRHRAVQRGSTEERYRGAVLCKG